MLLDDVMLPSESAKFIMKHAKLIEIDQKGVEKVAKQILNAAKDGSIEQVAFAAHKLHPKNADHNALQWVFLIDTINFSFWPDEGKKYDVSYENETFTGYFAACAAVNKALSSGIPMLSAEWMANVKREEVDAIFKSDSGHSIPLLDERVKAINESGNTLIEKFNGQFYNCLSLANKSAQNLLALIVENFKSFRDFATFEGKKVSILKRAQILVADVYGALIGHDPLAEFDDINTLTMFADYRVPQALAYLGVLKYSPELLQKLGEGKRLENGSREEVELRGASIAACDEIVKEMNRLRKENIDFKDVREVPAMEVDVYIWVYRRKNAENVEKTVPFHRTRCIYY